MKLESSRRAPGVMGHIVGVVFLALLITGNLVYGRPVEEDSDADFPDLLKTIKRELEDFEAEVKVNRARSEQLAPDSTNLLKKLAEDGKRAMEEDRQMKAGKPSDQDRSKEQKYDDIPDVTVVAPGKEGKSDIPFPGEDPMPDRPEWMNVIDLMERARTLPVYNALQYCRSDAMQKMKFISKSCHLGTCTGDEYCKLCYGCCEKQYRSLEGSCNDLGNIFAGSTGFPFERNIPIEEIVYEVPIDEPNIRFIAQELLKRHEFKPHKSMNLLGVAYYQFFFHDFLQRGNDPKRSFSIRIPRNDPLSGHIPDIKILGTQFHDFGCPFNFSKDMATAWIDGSQIYGSNAAVNTKLRTRSGGKIRLDEDGKLPFENKIPVTGHTGGFWIGVYSFHTLFVKEHNTITDMLAELNPEWSDDELFNVARLINSAQMYKAFIASMLPVLQPGLEMTCLGKWLWSGTTKEDLLSHGDADPGNLKSVYPPVWGNPEQDVENALSTSEDLGAVNRIHALTPETLETYDYRLADPNTMSPPARHRFSYEALDFSFEFTEKLKDENSDEDLLYSMGVERAGAVVLNNYPTSYMRTTAYVDTASSPTMAEIGFDMSLADLLRDRERGTPRYCQYLRLMDKPAPRAFEDMTNGDSDLTEALRAVYGNVEKVDLLIGLMVSSQVDNDGLIPPLTLEILIAHLHRKIASDRFFTSDFNTKTYTSEGMFWIKRNDLRSIICRHYTDLCPMMDKLKNPLAVWDDNAAQAMSATTELL